MDAGGCGQHGARDRSDGSSVQGHRARAKVPAKRPPVRSCLNNLHYLARNPFQHFLLPATVSPLRRRPAARPPPAAHTAPPAGRTRAAPRAPERPPRTRSGGRRGGGQL